MFHLKNILIIIIFLLLSFQSASQSKINLGVKNEMNIELLGSSVWYSLNYERQIRLKNNLEYKISTGFNFNPFRLEYRTVGINFEPKIVYNLKRNSLVFGIGYTYIFLFDNLRQEIFGCCADLNLLIPRLGYRRYTKSNLKYWGISFNPIFVLDLNEEGDEWDNHFIIPWGGIQYGWRF